MKIENYGLNACHCRSHEKNVCIYVILGSHEFSTGRLGGAWDGADGRLSVNYWRIERVIKCATARYV